MKEYFMRITDIVSGQNLSFGLEDGAVVISGDLDPKLAFEIGNESFKISPLEDTNTTTLVQVSGRQLP